MSQPSDRPPTTPAPHRIAVTGAGGFVGRHLVPHLREHGHPVVPVTRSTSVKDGDRSIADYGDTQALEACFAGADVVVHLAARAHQRDVPDADRAFHEANVATTSSVAEACRRSGVRRLVYVSSIGVHGNRSAGHAFTERDAPAPAEPYARSKLAAEQAVARALADGPTDYVIVRPPLVYGPGCPGNFALLMRLAARAPVIPLGALEAPRRFIGVHNLVDALRVASVHPAVSRRTFVLGDARDVTVGEILRIAVTARGRSLGRVWNLPPTWLRALAALVGQTAAFDKLAAPLQVDPAAFGSVTGWCAPVSPERGLAEAALGVLP